MSAWWRVAVAFVVLGIAVAVDTRLGREAMFEVPYALIVLIGLWWNSPNKTLVLAVGATLGALVPMAIGSPNAVDGDGTRGLGLVFIWVVALAIILRQRMEARMGQRASLAEALVNSAPATMFVRDLDSRYLLINPALRALRNIGDAEFIGTTPDKYNTPEEARIVLESDRNVLATGKLDVGEKTTTLPDGSVQTRLISRFPIHDESGAVIAIGGVAADVSELRRAERAQQESEALLRAFLDHMPGLVNLKDTEGRYLIVNKDFKDWFDLREEDVYGKTVHDLFPGRPENAVVDENERRVLGTGAITVHDAEIAGAHGQVMKALNSKFPVSNSEGNLVAVGTISLNVTEQRRIEAALRQSEANHRSLIDESQIGIFIYRGETMVYANRALTHLFGFGGPEERLSVDEVLDRVVEHDRHRVRQFIGIDETPYQSSGAIEVECRHRDDTALWVDVSSHAMTWEGEAARAVLLLDKTGSRRAETQLRDAIEGMSDGLAFYDGADQLVLFNRALGQLWHDRRASPTPGMTYEQHMQALVASGLVPETFPDGRDWLQARLAWHADPQGAFEYQLTDGRWLRTTERRGESSGTIVVVIDVTEIRRRDADLDHAQKMEAIGQLTGGVAHDFNNLLSVVLGNLEIASDSLAPGSASARFVENAADAAKRGATLTQRLLAFSRKQALEPRVLDVRDLLSGMADMLSRTLGETIELDVVVSDDLWPCRADPAQLENAILNLAINARDAMPDGGKLTIETANARLDDHVPEAEDDVKPGPYVQISVTDTGMGMSAETQSRAFEPFFTTKDVGAGSGLGLSMVYGFAKQSRGHVSIYSEPGDGTTVNVYLPRERLVAETRVEQVPEDVPLGTGEMILVVEDDADVRDMVLSMLGGLGYRTLEADNGESALKIASDPTTGIDLLLTDIVLPGGMNGREVANEIKSLRPSVQALFMSGYAESAIVRNGHVDDDVALLQKPFGRRELARKVHQALSKPATG